jgi:excisionase family DNA binding protein
MSASEGAVVTARSAASVEPYVPIEEAARFLAVPLSWLYDAASKGKVPSRKIGKYRRFRLSELDAWTHHG